MKKIEILAKLKEIEALELAIEDRIIENILPTYDVESGLELSESTIVYAIERLAEQIATDPTLTNPVLIGIMDGALPFASQLQAELIKRNFRFQYTTTQATSYNGTQAGKVSIQTNPKVNITGRDVLLIDEVLDKGNTLSDISFDLKKLNPRSIKTAVLVDKHQERITAIKSPSYSCFVVVKEAFIVGLGLDYKHLVRNLKFIGCVDPDSLPTTAEEAILDTKNDLCAALEACIDDAKQVIQRYTYRWFKAKPTSFPNQETHSQSQEIVP